MGFNGIIILDDLNDLVALGGFQISKTGGGLSENDVIDFSMIFRGSNEILNIFKPSTLIG